MDAPRQSSPPPSDTYMVDVNSRYAVVIIAAKNALKIIAGCSTSPEVLAQCNDDKLHYQSLDFMKLVEYIVALYRKEVGDAKERYEAVNIAFKTMKEGAEVIIAAIGSYTKDELRYTSWWYYSSRRLELNEFVRPIYRDIRLWLEQVAIWKSGQLLRSLEALTKTTDITMYDADKNDEIPLLRFNFGFSKLRAILAEEYHQDKKQNTGNSSTEVEHAEKILGKVAERDESVPYKKNNSVTGKSVFDKCEEKSDNNFALSLRFKDTLRSTEGHQTKFTAPALAIRSRRDRESHYSNKIKALGRKTSNKGVTGGAQSSAESIREEVASATLPSHT